MDFLAYEKKFYQDRLISAMNSYFCGESKTLDKDFKLSFMNADFSLLIVPQAKEAKKLSRMYFYYFYSKWDTITYP